MTNSVHEIAAIEEDLMELAARPLDGDPMRFSPADARSILRALAKRRGHERERWGRALTRLFADWKDRTDHGFPGSLEQAAIDLRELLPELTGLGYHQTEGGGHDYNS